ncbi:MAG: hypothetical protein SGBAC_007611 [Bacillariaceae sp.]
MPSKGPRPSSFRQSLSMFEHRQSLRSKGSVEEAPSDPPSFRKSLSMFEHRQSKGSNGSFEVPPGFQTSLNIFENGEERNPLLPSFFQDDHIAFVARRSDASNELKKEFEFSLKHAKVQEGRSLSVKQIIDFQAGIRGYLERKLHKKYVESIVQLQSIGRGILQKRRFDHTIEAAIRCQSIVRRHLVRRGVRRRYYIQKPPHILKLRNHIAAIQLKLDAINEERERMNKERERRKVKIKKECLERFAKQERDKTLGIAHVQKSGSQLISYLQTENNALRVTMRGLDGSIKDLRSENKSLERDNQVVARCTNELHIHYKKMKERNVFLQKQTKKLRNDYTPRWEDAIAERTNHTINESRQKYVYRQGVFKIVDNVFLDQSCDSNFKDDIARVVGRCEGDFDCELDIDTPLELYPSPPEQESMISSFKLEDEKSVALSHEDEPFAFLDDADFLLPGLESFTSTMHTDDGDVDDSSSTSSSSSSTKCSDSSSSTNSSDDRSQMSGHSYSSTAKGIATYFEQNDASAISPIAKKFHTETGSTACNSRDKSEYEVKSASYETATSVVNTEVETDSDSGTCSSTPPWEINGETHLDLGIPTVINILSTSELEGKKQASSDALTLTTTASTTAIESEFSSCFVDVDLESRNGSIVFYHQPGDIGGANVKEEEESSCFIRPHQETQNEKSQVFDGPGTKSLQTREVEINMLSADAAPRKNPKPKHPNVVDQKEQGFRAKLPLTTSQPKVPCRSRQPSTSSPIEVVYPKPFHARPAPKFGEPKIPVRGRDPAKLRSTLKASPAPSRSPQKLPVRSCNSGKLRAAS